MSWKCRANNSCNRRNGNTIGAVATNTRRLASSTGSGDGAHRSPRAPNRAPQRLPGPLGLERRGDRT
jgi:hypothetical protein